MPDPTDPKNQREMLFCAWELLFQPCVRFRYWHINDKARWNLYSEGAD